MSRFSPSLRLRSSLSGRAVILCLALLAPLHAAAPPVTARQCFNSTVAPFLEAHCISCHGSLKAKGKVTLHGISPDPKDEKSVALWERVLEQLEIEAMPPPERKQPAAARREQVIEWIKSNLAEAGKGFLVKSRLLLPEYGNRVSHELLFDGSVKDLPASPSRLWRISPYIHKGKGFHAGPGPGGEPLTFSTRTDGLRDYSSQEIVGESAFLALMMAFDDLITRQMHDTKSGLGRPSFKAVAEAKGEPTRAAMEKVIREEYLRAIGHPPSADDVERYLNFMAASIKRAGNESGLKVAVMAIYLSPHAIYRMELGLGKKDEHGRRMLSPRETAFAVSYALTDSPPEAVPAIREALEKGRLSTREEVEKVVRRIIADGAPPTRMNLPGPFDQLRAQGKKGYAYLPRVLRFFEEFFEYPRAAGVFKDGKNGTFGPRAVPGVAQGHIAAIVNEDREVFKELLTSSRFNFNRDHILARLEADHQERMKALPEARKEAATQQHERMRKMAAGLPQETFRAGVLMDPAWLIAHSKCTENDPVRRGKWIRERLLAGSVPELPIGVEAKIPEDHDRTLRQRFSVVEKPECWRCHKRMNPLGMPFENFNDVGRIRTGMYLHKKKKEFLETISADQAAKMLKEGAIESFPVDATGELTGTGDESLDGPVKDARDLVFRLAKSTRVRQSIIRHAFRYWMGRNETLGDSRTLIAADRAYTKSGGKFSEVVVSLLTSDSFLYRR